MGHMESLEMRTLFAATADGLDGWLHVYLNDADNVTVTINDGIIEVSSDGAVVFRDDTPSSSPTYSLFDIHGNNGGDTISFFSDHPNTGVVITGGSGADRIHVEGTDGATLDANIHGNNGADAFSLVNVHFARVYGENGDDICRFTNATDAIFDGGRGDDLELLA